MGCCFSRPAGPNAPYPGGAPSGSARAINSPRLRPLPTDESAPASPNVSQSDNQQQGQSPTQSHHRRRSQRPLSQHIDKPLRRHVWTAKTSEKRSRHYLDEERTEFFDTRVDGRPEVWQAIHGALEVLWESDARQQADTTSGDEAQDGDLALAQGILHAADITLPTGDLINGAYDALGHWYSLPEHIVSDPTNVVDNLDDAGETTEGVDDEEDDEVARRREEKGKTVADFRDMIKVRARLSEDARDIVIGVSSSEHIRVLARKIAEEADLPLNKRVRIAYMGKILKKHHSLVDQGWKPGHVINALVFSQ